MARAVSGRRRRILVLGCGSIGSRHAANLSRLRAGELLAYDPDPSRRSAVRRSLGIETSDSLRASWNWAPDAVVIATPTSTHLRLALDAARRGCDLFVEKPLGHRWTGVENLLRDVRSRGLTTLVGCNMRFHPAIRKMKSLIDGGRIGRVLAARFEMGSNLTDWHPGRDYRSGYSSRRALGGGVILDVIHEIDYARWFLGEVESVACFAGHLSRLEIDTEDVAALIARFRGGSIGEFHLDYVQRPYSRSCHIIGESGTVKWDFGGPVRWYTSSGGRWQVSPQPDRWDTNRMYLDEMRHFLSCLGGAQSPLVDVAEGARSLKVALAAKESSRKGKVVRLRG